jgi:hypothetical protein
VLKHFHVRQLAATYCHSSGTPPACVYAMLYYTIHELEMPINLWLCLALYKWYIDDGIGIWIGPEQLWTKFQTWVNSFGSLHWIFTGLLQKIDYLDTTIQLNRNITIQTTLFKKLAQLISIPASALRPPPPES